MARIQVRRVIRATAGPRYARARRPVGPRGGREDLDPALLAAAVAAAADRLGAVERRALGAQGDEGVIRAGLVGLGPGERRIAGPPGRREGFLGRAGRRP